MAVAGFGDGALTPLIAAGLFRGDESEIGHQMARMFEAKQVAQPGAGGNPATGPSPNNGGTGWLPARRANRGRSKKIRNAQTRDRLPDYLLSARKAECRRVASDQPPKLGH